MTNKEIKKTLMKNDQVFTTLDSMGKRIELKTWSSGEDRPTSSIWQNKIMGPGMNVEKWGSKMVFLYSFDMMGNKTKAVIRYEDVKFV